jgi:hypothetical protein
MIPHHCQLAKATSTQWCTVDGAPSTAASTQALHHQPLKINTLQSPYSPQGGDLESQNPSFHAIKFLTLPACMANNFSTHKAHG